MNLLLKEYKRDRSFFMAAVLVIALAAVLVIVLVEMHMPNGGAHNTIPTTAIPASKNGSGNSASISGGYVARIKNLTSESLYYPNNMSLIGNVIISKINSVSVAAKPVTVQAGSILNVSVLYNGEFGFDLYNSTPYLNATREVHYFGFYQQGASNMLVYENMPNVSDYFTLLFNKTVIGTPPGYDDTKYLSIDFQVVPTVNASGKSWEFCGGAFMSYSNNTNWGTTFNDLTYSRENASNSTIFNIISGKCTSVRVT